MDALFGRFSRVWFFTSLVSKVPFENELSDFAASLASAKRVLGRGVIEFNADKDRLDLKDPEPPEAKQEFEISFLERRSITVALGIGYSEERRFNLYRELWDKLLGNIKVVPEAVDFLDKRVELRLSTARNPEVALTYLLRGSKLFDLLSGTRVYRCQPTLLFSPDSAGARVCRVDLKTNITGSQVDAPKRTSESNLDIGLSMGLVEGLGELKDVRQALLDHVKFARDYIESRLVPDIVDPVLAGLDAQKDGD